MIAAFGAPKAEWVGFFLGAVRVAVPSLLPPLDSPAHEVADTEQLRRELTNAGLTDVRVETTTWRVRFRSALHLWDVATFSNPSRARLTSDLSDRQVAEAQQVLDGMLRERSGGHPGAVLLTELDVGTGVKRAAGPKVP